MEEKIVRKCIRSDIVNYLALFLFNFFKFIIFILRNYFIKSPSAAVRKPTSAADVWCVMQLMMTYELCMIFVLEKTRIIEARN